MPAPLRIGHKRILALAALLLTTVAVAVVGLSGLSNVNRRATALHADNIGTTETTSTLRSYSRLAGRVADGQLGERLTPWRRRGGRARAVAEEVRAGALPGQGSRPEPGRALPVPAGPAREPAPAGP